MSRGPLGSALFRLRKRDVQAFRIIFQAMIRSTNPNTERRVQGKSSTFSREAQLAIARGVDRGDPTAELEYLGLPLRTINLLENSHFQIVRLEQLVSLSRDQLLEIPNLGSHGLRELLLCLSRYDELDEIKCRMSKALGERLKPFDPHRPTQDE